MNTAIIYGFRFYDLSSGEVCDYDFRTREDRDDAARAAVELLPPLVSRDLICWEATLH